MQEYFRVVFSIDENFVDYLAVTIQSLIENADINKKYIVSILANGFSARSKRILSSFEKENIKIEFYNVKEKLEELNIETLRETMHWSVATYYRILIPFLFPDDKKVLYLDCDTVILDDVSKMFECDLEGNLIGAVIDYDTERYPKSRIKYMIEDLKLKNYKNYFNAGVILFDIEKIEKNEYLNQFMELMKRKFKFLDQDILNIMFEDKTKLLDLEWNYQYHFIFPKFKKLYNLNTKEPKIIHYTTSTKPWNTPEFILCDLWWKFARKTPSYESIIYKNASYEVIAALDVPIRFLYRFYKIANLFAFGKIKKGIKGKIRKIKPCYDRLRK